MEKNLFTFLKYEQQLLEELVRLSEQQQKALIKYDTTMLSEITAYQDEVAKSLRSAEEQRIKMLMAWLSVSRKQATDMTLSSLSELYKGDEYSEISEIKENLQQLVAKLTTNNSLNRVLANRAARSVRDMIIYFTNGTNQLCNVKI